MIFLTKGAPATPSRLLWFYSRVSWPPSFKSGPCVLLYRACDNYDSALNRLAEGGSTYPCDIPLSGTVVVSLEDDQMLRIRLAHLRRRRTALLNQGQLRRADASLHGRVGSNQPSDRNQPGRNQRGGRADAGLGGGLVGGAVGGANS